MFSFLSNAVEAVLGGEDDDGFFDLASAEELIQRLEHSSTGSFPFPTSEHDAEAETAPEIAPPLTSQLPTNVPGYLPQGSVPLPEEEQAILCLKLPKDGESPDRQLTDICREQENIITPDDTATTSETPESSVTPPEYDIISTEGSSNLGHVHGHMLITPPKHPAKDEIATVIDITDSPVTRGLTPLLQTEAPTIAVLGRAVTPKKYIINTVKSLKDIVRETSGEELEAISFDDIHGGIWHNTAPIIDIVAAEETLAPLFQTPPQKTVQENVSNKIGPPLSTETKSHDKKKRAPRCSKCHEQGHLKRTCPRRKKLQDEQTPAEQPVPLSLAQMLEDNATPPALAVLPPQTHSNNTGWSVINLVAGISRILVRTGEDRVHPATSFALLGHPELMANDDSEADKASDSLQHVFGPSTLVSNGSAHNLSGLFGPSYLTDGYWGKDALDETRSASEPVAEQRKIEEPLETGRDMSKVFPGNLQGSLLPSTLTEKQGGTHRFTVLGPEILMTDVNQPEPRDTEQEDADIYWDTGDTLISPVPKTGILKVIANHVPWVGSRREVADGNARGEGVEPRPPAVVLLEPTSARQVSEARHPVALRPKDRPLTAVTGKKDRATKPVNEMVDIVRAPTLTIAEPATKGVLTSPKILPLGTQNGPLHKSEPLRPHPTSKKSKKLPKLPKTPRKSQQPPEKELDNTGSTAPAIQPLSHLSKRRRRKASTQRRKVKEAASLVAQSLPYKATIAPHIEAWSYASVAYSSPGGSLTGEFGPHHLVMWTDATFPDESLNKRLQAMAVTYRQPSSSPPPPLSSFSDIQSASDENTNSSGWRDFAYAADIERESSSSLIDVLETLAVELAVSLALREVVDKKPPPPPSSAEPSIRKVTVFTDSQAALLCLQIPRNAPVETYAAQLKQRGVEVHLRWVPGHANLGGNERADRLALLASNYAPAPETEGGLVRVPVPLLRACERQVELMEAWCRAGDQGVLRPFMRVQRRELKEALRAAGVEEGWVGGGGGDCG
ncbi:hypothetical protein GE09DRAFT_1050169 [Coniochaeta sp. 2T2.1]|nr:hypothetical protein GE09DRAFT_1050169 [Coniochaeta sp. 2T2.1]